MKQKKNCLVGVSGNNNNYLPNVEVRVISGCALEVVLVTGLNCQFMFNGIIRLLHEEEGVEVVSASFSQLDTTVFHTVHAKVRTYIWFYELPSQTQRTPSLAFRLRRGLIALLILMFCF